MYELPLKEKQWVLQQINETQWNDEVIHGLNNEMLTDLWFQFIRVCGGRFSGIQIMIFGSLVPAHFILFG